MGLGSVLVKMRGLCPQKLRVQRDIVRIQWGGVGARRGRGGS